MASQWSGFLLWNSSSHNFTIAHTAAKRDIFAEYVAESKARGMRAGVFWSAWRNFYLGVCHGRPGGCNASLEDCGTGGPCTQSPMFGGPALSQEEYFTMARTQFDELLSHGQIFDWWFDAQMNSIPQGFQRMDGLVNEWDARARNHTICFSCTNFTTPSTLRWVGNEGVK